LHTDNPPNKTRQKDGGQVAGKPQWRKAAKKIIINIKL
jgi:hypothetical protein